MSQGSVTALPRAPRPCGAVSQVQSTVCASSRPSICARMVWLLGSEVVGALAAGVPVAHAVPAGLGEHGGAPPVRRGAPTAAARPTAPGSGARRPSGSPRWRDAPPCRRDRGRSGTSSRPARRCAARRARLRRATAITSSASAMRRAASMHFRLFPPTPASALSFAVSVPLLLTPLTCGPASARAAIGPDASQRRYLGALRAEDRARPFERPQIGPDQGQRKEGDPHVPRQIGHVLPRCLSNCAEPRRAGPASARRPRPEPSRPQGRQCRPARAVHRQRRTTLRQRLRQYRQQAREAIGASCRRLAASSSDVAAAKHQHRKRELGTLARPQIGVECRLVGNGSGSRSLACASIMPNSSGAGSSWLATASRSGVGDRIAGAHPRLASLQRVAPPLQADLAHHRLARTRWPTRASSLAECGQRQQAVARRRRGQQGGEVAVGLARREPTRQRHRCAARPAFGHVSRGGPPPPWPT